MGQQQLLLIVLGVIIVGVAVVVGINLFEANSRESLKNTKAAQVMSYSQIALAYYKKPKSFGGGGRSFANLPKPPGDENWAPNPSGNGWVLMRPGGEFDLPVWTIVGTNNYAYIRYISSDIYYDESGGGNHQQHIYIRAYVYPTEIRMEVRDSEM